MTLAKKEIAKLQEIATDYKLYSNMKYCSDILESELCFIVGILAKNSASTWLRQFTMDLIEVSTMCEIILENQK